MGSTFRFLGIDSDADLVLGWFRSLPQPPEEVLSPRYVALYFRAFGPLAYLPSSPGSADPFIDSAHTPLVTVFLPRKVRGALWTTGEVHFLPTSTGQTCLPLVSLSRRFSKWLERFPLVFTGRAARPGQWNYYLEAGVVNTPVDIHALPLAMEALTRGQYFIPEDVSDARLDILCRSLRHRDVQGLDP